MNWLFFCFLLLFILSPFKNGSTTKGKNSFLKSIFSLFSGKAKYFDILVFYKGYPSYFMEIKL